MIISRSLDDSELASFETVQQLSEWTSNLVRGVARQLERQSLPRSPLQDLDSAPESTAWHLRTWELLTAGFARMHRNGLLAEDTDPSVLATSFMTALQGGYTLSVAAHDIGPLEIAVEMAFRHVDQNLAASSADDA
jgi:hypothetical protein